MGYHAAYRILPDYRLIVSYYSGTISEKEIIALKETIRGDKDFNMGYNTLDDFSDTDFNVSQESYTRIFDWLQVHYSFGRKSAVMTSTPQQVVNITMFNYIQKFQLPMKIKIFSTLQGALNWVNISMKDAPVIKGVLEELKNRKVTS